MRDAKEVTEMEEGKGEGGTEGLEGLLDGVFDSPKKPVPKTPVVPAKVLPEETKPQPVPNTEASGLDKAEPRLAPAKASSRKVFVAILTAAFLIVGGLFYFSNDSADSEKSIPGNDTTDRNVVTTDQPVTQTAQVINTKDFNQNAEDTVRLFYGWISEGRYAEVYDEVFSEYRKSKITKEGFIGGFRNTVSVTPLEVRTTQQDDSRARVAVKVKSLDRSETGGPEIEKVFQGEWVLVKSDGSWLLDRSNIRQVSVSGEGKASKQALVLPDGSKYEGEVVNGKPHGKGIAVDPGGKRYDGDWVNGKRHGKGTYTWPNGQRYEGDVVDGKIHGKGTYTWPNGARYEGDFVDGNFHGKGTYTWPNGNRYEGDFLNGKMSGKGILTFANGDRYEGDFVDDKFHGYGTVKDKNGNLLDKGRFENDDYVGP